MRKILKEPLLHFFLLGAVIFVSYTQFFSPGTDNVAVIPVTRDRLLTFMQYRARQFDEKHFDEILNGLGEEQVKALINDYERQEALYRTAKAMGLDNDDYLMRRLLIQKMEFILENTLSMQLPPLTGEDIKAYYAAHQAQYKVLPTVTFTHVFFDSEHRGPPAARAAAKKMGDRLNRDHVPFEKAAAFGDRFLYAVNYVGKAPDYIASHFDPRMEAQLFSLPVARGEWQGPFQSDYGYHLVMVTKKVAAHVPKLADIKARVKDDAERARRQKALDQAIREIEARYRFDRTVGLPGAVAQAKKG